LELSTYECTAQVFVESLLHFPRDAVLVVHML